MSPEEKELLKETAELVKENHKILKGMRRSARFGSFLRLIYWLIILGSAFSAYYFLQPYIDAVTKGYNSMQENIESVKNVTTKLPSLPSWLGGKQ
jgi:hypothetical protein